MRDILVGVILPWSVSNEQQHEIRARRIKLDSNIKDDIDLDAARDSIQDTLIFVTKISEESTNIKYVGDKLDCARLSIQCILNQISKFELVNK